MKRYIYIFFVLALFATSCEKERYDPAPPPSPNLPITCTYEGVEFDNLKDIVLDSDGGNLVFEVKDECALAYFSDYCYWYDDKKPNRVLIQFPNYKGIDKYECDLFELKQIDEYHFNVRIFPSERDLKIYFGFHPHWESVNHYHSTKLTVVVNGR